MISSNSCEEGAIYRMVKMKNEEAQNQTYNLGGNHFMDIEHRKVNMT